MTKRITFIGLFLCLGLGLACSNREKKGTAQASEPVASAEKAQEEKKEASGKDDLCGQFFSILDDALSIHLTRVPSEKQKLLERSFANLLEEIRSVAKSDEVKNAVAELEGMSPTTCEPYSKLSEKIQLKDPTGDRLTTVLQWALAHFFHVMDINSNYFNAKQSDDLFGQGGDGAGLIFLQRTDYAFERLVPYLVLEGAYPGSVNEELVQSGRLPVGSRIIKISDKDISKIGYRDSIKMINRDDLKEDDLEKLPREIQISVLKPGKANADVEEVELKTGAFERDFARVDYPDKNKSIVRLRITHFFPRASDNLTKAWANVLKDLLDRNEGNKIEGLILDLRGNGGGLDVEAKAILEAFFPSHTPIVWKKSVKLKDEEKEKDSGRKEISLEKTETLNDRLVLDVPAMVVLIDRGSASASEMVAAAMKDYGRALIVGERSHGKGIGQRVFSKGSGNFSGLYLVTDSYFYSPSGKSHQMQGVIPDIEVVDSANEVYQKKSGKPARMNDYQAAKNGKFKDSLIHNPGELSPPPNFKTIDDIRYVSPEILQQIKKMNPPKIASCRAPDASPPLLEEEDCLLDSGVFYLKSLHQLLSNR